MDFDDLYFLVCLGGGVLSILIGVVSSGLAWGFFK